MSRTYGLYDRMAIMVVMEKVVDRDWAGRESYCRIQHLRPPVPWLLYGSSARPTGPHTEGT